MKRLRTIALVLLALVAVAAIAVAVPARRVVGDEMAWTLRDGDWVWIVPDRVRKADVVWVEDPLDPSRTVLRRVVAVAGQKVVIDDGGVRVNGKRIRQQEMGDPPNEAPPGETVLKEVIWSKPPARANKYFPILSDRPVRWSSDGVVEVPDGHWYVLADNRDAALDSRWWGPVPQSAIKGVVRARWGEADIWRESAFQLVIPEE